MKSTASEPGLRLLFRSIDTLNICTNYYEVPQGHLTSDRCLIRVRGLTT